MCTVALINQKINKKKLEISFIAIFSILICATFYTVISMNGVVLGNDPAVHLEKAQIFLDTGKIPLVNLGWTPPLYQIILAMFIALSGASDIGALIFWVKILAVVCDWLFFLSVYLIGSKFFNKKVGAISAVLLLFSFPMYEANQFGGYTTVLALAFMVLVFLYTPLAVERLGYLAVTFFVAFGVVLSHQLATFLAVFIMPPVLLYMLIKSKGANLKVVIALLLGGGIAFFLYYFQAMIGYIDLVVEYVFFAVKTYAYQIPAVSLKAFITNFGFILFFAVAGIVVSFYQLRKQKKMLYFVILILSFAVPLFFAESYLVGFYMPFGWFIYYLLPLMAIFGGVSIAFFLEEFSQFYSKHRTVIKNNWAKVATIAIIVLLSLLVVYRSDVVYGKIMEASIYYSTSDKKAYDAGIWLRANYPENITVVTTEIPGFWFQEFSGKNVTAQTDLRVQRNEIAEAVLSLSYEVEHPETLVRAYEAKGAIYEEVYISIDDVWNRVAFSSGSGDFLNYTVNGVNYRLQLNQLSKQIVFEDQGAPKKIQFTFSNDDVAVTKTLIFQNDSYPISVEWGLTPLKSQIYNVTLYLSTFFDLKYNFDQVQIPQLLNWVNPWDASTNIKTTNGNEWAVANFTSADLQDHYIGLYDTTNKLAYAFNFNDLPTWGNIGALAKRQIDAVRFQYDFSTVNVNQTASCSYQYLALSKNHYPALEPQKIQGLFTYKTSNLNLRVRDFSFYIAQNNIGFIVYDRNELDTQMIHSKILQLIFSNDRYVIFKIVR